MVLDVEIDNQNLDNQNLDNQPWTETGTVEAPARRTVHDEFPDCDELPDCDEFLERVMTDDELVRAEFEAIINASWDEPPPTRPQRPAPSPGRARRRRIDGATPRPTRLHHPGVSRQARQRSPP